MLNLPSPIIEIKDARLDGMQLFVKRDDLIHSAISGNKWRKLKYNLIYAKKNNIKKIITKGGAFSNHIYAVAAAGKYFDFQTIGIIRGEDVENPTLDFARKCGMKLVFVTRTEFRNINNITDVEQLGIETEESSFLPEGGTNQLALEGTKEIVDEAITQLGFCPEFCCVAAGTGGTAAGIIEGFDNQATILVFAALKGDFLQHDIANLLPQPYANWQFETNYHFGGYAKFDTTLIDFMNDFRQKTAIPLEPIYTGKLFYGIFDKIEKGFFPKGSRILAIHTGGLQGLDGFRFLHGDLLHK